MIKTRWISMACLVGAMALLTGCATTRTAESAVQSFSSLQTAPSPATYRLDLLPSQRAQQTNFAAIEALAEQSLQRVGLSRDDSKPKLLIQISAQANTSLPDWPYYSGPWGGMGGWGWGGWGYGRGVGMGMGMGWRDMPPTLYRRAVKIVMRDSSTQQVVYETSAEHEDIWTADPEIFGVLFNAALTGFPNPPAGPRQVRTVIDKKP